MHYGYYSGPFGFLMRLAPLIFVVIIVALRTRRRNAFRSSTSVIVPSPPPDPKYGAWRDDPLAPVQPPAGVTLDSDEIVYYSAAASITEAPITSSTDAAVVRLSMNVQAGSPADTSLPAAAIGGTLTITNKRLIYGSNEQNFMQSFDAPGSVLVPLNTGIALVPKQGGGGLFFKTGDPIAGIILQRATSKTLVAIAPEPGKWNV
ncbi:MAG: hypothetical protein WAK16_06880 [Candidatus Cybelea sp.]